MRMTEKFMVLVRRDKRGFAKLAWMTLLYSPVATGALIFLGLTTLAETRRLTALEADGVKASATVTAVRQSRSTWVVNYTFSDNKGAKGFGVVRGLERPVSTGSQLMIVYSASKPSINESNLPKLRAHFSQRSAIHNLLVALFLVGPVGLLALTIWVRSIGEPIDNEQSALNGVI